MRTNSAFLMLTLLAVLLTTTIGCKPKNPDGREDVKGKITLNGEPVGVKNGVCAIKFEPTDSSDMRAGGSAQIQNGEYLLTGQDGVKPGKYIVRITYTATFDKTTNDFADANTLMENEYQVALVPPEFNTDSTIEFEVVAKKKNVFNYDIVTDFAGETLENKKKGGAVE